MTPTSHLLDLLFEPEATMTGRAKVSKAPGTYLNRLKLKKDFKNKVNALVTRERIFSAEEKKGKSSLATRLVFLAIMIATILAIRFTGASRYLEQDTLRQLIGGYSALAPVIYMIVYTVAPALFLPGLSITIAGGVFFGPFWGMVYTITSATFGAFILFWSHDMLPGTRSGKLRSPRWRRLDQGVEKHGWKIVAFTRLIPVFPFNLLNYAFGLTKINFFHYAIATFVCMLPACIAYIVFSSSFLDILRGKMPPTFFIGLGLIITVSLIPLFYKRYKAEKSDETL